MATQSRSEAAEHKARGKALLDEAPSAAAVDRALRAFEQAIALDPDDAEARLLKGKALAEHRDAHQQAIACFDEALRVDDSCVDCWVAKGTALTELRRYEEAIDCYKRATVLRPDEGEAHYLRGVALMALDRLGEALEEIGSAIALAGAKHFRWWYTKLDVIERIGDRELLQSCLADLARMCKQAGCAAEVVADLDRMIARQPAEPRHLLQKGCLLAMLERLDEAAAVLEEASARFPDTALAWYLRARVAAACGRRAVAREALERALSLDSALEELARGEPGLRALIPTA